jgi:predicted 3-demethylubiquinone-9 3-methyltransferase (glyoxalase superfamily)
MQKIVPFLWFDNQAEEAVNFYTSVFKNSKILRITHYGEGAPIPKGTVMTIDFLLNGQEFVALNGGPVFTINSAISFVVNCKTQEEIDDLWNKLTEAGEEQECGWLKDRYGVTWQIVPDSLPKMMSDKDPAKSQKVMQAIYHMKKIDLKTLERAYKSA